MTDNKIAADLGSHNTQILCPATLALVSRQNMGTELGD